MSQLQSRTDTESVKDRIIKMELDNRTPLPPLTATQDRQTQRLWTKVEPLVRNDPFGSTGPQAIAATDDLAVQSHLWHRYAELHLQMADEEKARALPPVASPRPPKMAQVAVANSGHSQPTGPNVK
jgi:hypothetical protein